MKRILVSASKCIRLVARTALLHVCCKCVCLYWKTQLFFKVNFHYFKVNYLSSVFIKILINNKSIEISLRFVFFSFLLRNIGQDRNLSKISQDPGKQRGQKAIIKTGIMQRYVLLLYFDIIYSRTILYVNSSIFSVIQINAFLLSLIVFRDFQDFLVNCTMHANLKAKTYNGRPKQHPNTHFCHLSLNSFRR